MSQISVRLERAESHFESAEQAAGFENKERKDQVLNEVSDNDVLGARFRHVLPDGCSTRKEQC